MVRGAPPADFPPSDPRRPRLLLPPPYLSTSSVLFPPARAFVSRKKERCRGTRVRNAAPRRDGGEEEGSQRGTERHGIEERGKWGCKSGGQTHYKFITDFPRRATLLRLRVGLETCYTGNSAPRVVTGWGRRRGGTESKKGR